jgi:hypothetical protein
LSQWTNWLPTRLSGQLASVQTRTFMFATVASSWLAHNWSWRVKASGSCGCGSPGQGRAAAEGAELSISIVAVAATAVHRAIRLVWLMTASSGALF